MAEQVAAQPPTPQCPLFSKRRRQGQPLLSQSVSRHGLKEGLRILAKSKRT